jgi:hypothetical protein
VEEHPKSVRSELVHFSEVPKITDESFAKYHLRAPNAAPIWRARFTITDQLPKRLAVALVTDTPVGTPDENAGGQL